MEVLDHTPRRVSPATRRLLIGLGALFVVGIVVTIIAVMVDLRLREQETTALQESYASALAVIEGAESRVRGTVAYSSPLLQSGPPDVRAALEALVWESVTDGRTEITAAQSAISDQRIWPWHADQQALKETLLAQLDERAETVTSATGQGLAVG
jgi:hypothetical protein